MKLYYKLQILFFVLIYLIACTKVHNSTPEQQTKIDSLGIKKDTIPPWQTSKPDTFPSIKYDFVQIKSQKQLTQILNRFNKTKDSDKSHILETLNRKEIRFIGLGSTIIVPDTAIADVRAYSVFPQFYEDARKIPKIVIVSNKMQCYGCYEWGKLIHFSAANTGKERTPTYPGRYSFVWRQFSRRSSINESWVMPYTWNFHAEAGNAFHQFDMPGRPVSHSCIRQLEKDAKWLYECGKGSKKDTNNRWIPYSGTTVLIIDYFDFNRTKGGPWLDLKSNTDSILTLPKDPMNYEEALIPIIQIPKTSRSVLRNKERYLYAEDTLRARGVIRRNIQLTPTVDYKQLNKEKAEKKRKEKLEKEKESQQQEMRPD